MIPVFSSSTFSLENEKREENDYFQNTKNQNRVEVGKV